MHDRDTPETPQENRAVVIENLVTLIEEMNPFLDCSGRAYCFMPHADATKRGMLPLRDRQVRSVLSFRHWEEHHAYPDRSRVTDAIEHFEGRLLANRIGPSVSADCPVLRCFLLATHDEEGGSGSAEDVLRMLRLANERNRLQLNRKTKLPLNPTAMGKWLAKNQLNLQSHGIEVFRPPRGSTKRLWTWRKVITDGDTCDTSKLEVSQQASLPKLLLGNEKLQHDTLTEEELHTLMEAQK